MRAQLRPRPHLTRDCAQRGVISISTDDAERAVPRIDMMWHRAPPCRRDIPATDPFLPELRTRYSAHIVDGLFGPGPPIASLAALSVAAGFSAADTDRALDHCSDDSGFNGDSDSMGDAFPPSPPPAPCAHPPAAHEATATTEHAPLVASRRWAVALLA